MLDDQLTFRRAIADLSYLTSANAYNYGAVASISADAAITDAAANTGYKALAEVLRNPYMPSGLFVDLPGVSLGGGMTTTGAPTSLKLTLTITFSDDGTNATGESISDRHRQRGHAHHQELCALALAQARLHQSGLGHYLCGGHLAYRRLGSVGPLRRCRTVQPHRYGYDRPGLVVS
jgi:hypothetical protein